MKKKLCAIFITILAFMLFAPAAFAADVRWRNVATIPPYVLCISRSYMTFHAINLTFRQNAVIFKLDRKSKAQEETL